MKRQSFHLFVVAVLALLGPLAINSRGDFILWNDEYRIVNEYHYRGTLYDRSRASIAGVPPGSVSYLNAYDSSTVGVSGGFVHSLSAYDSSTVGVVGVSGTSVDYLYAYNSSAVNISGGSVEGLYAYDFSSVDISGGSVESLYTYDAVNISGGSVEGLCAWGSSVANISGGSVGQLGAYDSSAVNISGGSVEGLCAWGSSVVTFYGQNFRVGGGLAFDGERVLGIGILSGEWMDGARWAVNITTNDPTATILAIPESAHKPFCIKYPRMDFNGDCKVDFTDFAIMASSWLECNLVPQSACWE